MTSLLNYIFLRKMQMPKNNNVHESAVWWTCIICQSFVDWALAGGLWSRFLCQWAPSSWSVSYVEHRWRGGGAGERGREEWCGRGWMNGPSVCSERLSGWIRNLPGMGWLTGSSWHAIAAEVKTGSFHADESGEGRGWAASSQPLTSKSEAPKQLLSQQSLGTKTDLSYWEEKGGWGEKCGCN